MPNPGKKINNAPQNAQTDTGTGSPKRVYQKIEKKATPIMQQKATPIMQQKATPIAQKKATPRNAQTDTGTGGGKTMMKKLKKANAEGASEAGATMMKKLTPTGQKKATPIARKTITEANGKGVNRRGSGEWEANPYVGRVGKTDDPFVEGFNSNDTSFASRYRRYRRNRGDNRRQTK